jgi:hypothetical protein
VATVWMRVPKKILPKQTETKLSQDRPIKAGTTNSPEVGHRGNHLKKAEQ